MSSRLNSVEKRIAESTTIVNALLNIVCQSNDLFASKPGYLSAAVLFFENLWKNATHYQDAVSEARNKPAFWTSLGHCIFSQQDTRPSRRYHQIALQARVYNILAMEAIGFKNSGTTLAEQVGVHVATILEKMKHEDRFVGILKSWTSIPKQEEANDLANPLRSHLQLDAYRTSNWLSIIDRCGNYGDEYAYSPSSLVSTELQKGMHKVNQHWSSCDSKGIILV